MYIETTGLIYLLLMLSAFIGGIFTAIGIRTIISKKHKRITVKDIIDKHEGEIWAEINPEGGSTCVLSLPTDL